MMALLHWYSLVQVSMFPRCNKQKWGKNKKKIIGRYGLFKRDTNSDSKLDACASL